MYAFASRATSLKDYVLLDNQSTDNVFCNPRLVSNIRRGERQLDLESNGGILPIFQVAVVKGFKQSVWFSKKAITNILSLLRVKEEYQLVTTGKISSFIVLRTDILTWFLSRIRLASMCWISMTQEVMQVMCLS